MSAEIVYTKDQLNQLFPVNEYGVHIKLRSDSGETKWLHLNKDKIKVVKKYLDLIATTNSSESKRNHR